MDNFSNCLEEMIIDNTHDLLSNNKIRKFKKMKKLRRIRYNSSTDMISEICMNICTNFVDCQLDMVGNIVLKKNARIPMLHPFMIGNFDHHDFR